MNKKDAINLAHIEMQKIQKEINDLDKRRGDLVKKHKEIEKEYLSLFNIGDKVIYKDFKGTLIFIQSGRLAPRAGIDVGENEGVKFVEDILHVRLDEEEENESSTVDVR